MDHQRYSNASILAVKKKNCKNAENDFISNSMQLAYPNLMFKLICIAVIQYKIDKDSSHKN